MKVLYTLIFLLFSLEISAKANLLIQCLAKEEEKMHKLKDTGVLYRLNQSFLNELATNNDISIKKNYVDEICSDKSKSASIGFLRLLLIKEEDIYDLSLSETDSSMRPYKMGYINEFQKQVPHLLVSYITGLQAEIEDAHCLTKSIPEINYLTEKLKYLEEEISIHQIISDKKKIDNIFKKLQNFKKIKDTCNKKSQILKNKLMEKNKNARSLKD